MAPPECANRLTGRRQQALETLLRAPSVAAASQASGISLRALWRYLEEPAFKAALRTRRSASLQRAESLLASASGTAVARLLKLADSANEWVALTATRALLELAPRYAEVGDVLDRLAALEAGSSAPQAARPPGRPVPFRAVPRRQA